MQDVLREVDGEDAEGTVFYFAEAILGTAEIWGGVDAMIKRKDLEALIVQWRAMRTAKDETFYDWCDYDMEIEAAKVAFEKCADDLTRLLKPLD